MAYCIYTDVQLKAGTACGTATTSDITNLIVESDAEIVDTLTQEGVTAPTSDNRLKRASVYLTWAALKRRQAHELSRSNSIGLNDGTSFSTSPEAEAANLEKKAHDEILLYVSHVNGTGIRVSRIRSRCR